MISYRSLPLGFYFGIEDDDEWWELPPRISNKAFLQEDISPYRRTTHEIALRLRRKVYHFGRAVPGEAPIKPVVLEMEQIRGSNVELLLHLLVVQEEGELRSMKAWANDAEV